MSELFWDQNSDGMQTTLDNRQLTITDDAILVGSTADEGVRVTSDWGGQLDVELWIKHDPHGVDAIEVYPLDGANQPTTVVVQQFNYSESAIVGAVAAALDHRTEQD